MATRLVRVNTLMGGGNGPEELAAYSQAIAELWPDMTTDEFEAVLSHGIKKVKWYGKFNVMAFAEFARRRAAYIEQRNMRPEYRTDGWEQL